MQDRMNNNLLSLAPSGIRRFTAMAKAVPDCAMLTIGEPDFDTPQPIKDACKQALDANKTHYPMNSGDPELRLAISQFEAQQNGLTYGPEEIIVTHGATEAIFTAMQGVLNPGDEVIIPQPAFSLYESIARLSGAVPVYLDTCQSEFQITEQALAGAITPRTKLLILNSPNNPTGCVYSEQTLQMICRAIAGKPIFVLCDDVYNRLVYEPCPMLAKMTQLKPQLLVVQSYSKPYAMTGWRMGYLMADRPIVEKLKLLHAAAVVSVASYAQDACIRALQCDISPMVETYRARRDYICERLQQMGLPAVRPAGAFYVFPSIAAYGMDSVTFCTHMIQEGHVAGVPGSCFGADGFIRLSYCYSMEEIETGMDRLERFLQSQ